MGVICSGHLKENGSQMIFKEQYSFANFTQKQKGRNL